MREAVFDPPRCPPTPQAPSEQGGADAGSELGLHRPARYERDRQSASAAAARLARAVERRQRDRGEPDDRPQFRSPGMAIAQGTENAYDTATGCTLLVPQGSRLIGHYNSVVAFGQSRALLIWQRLLLPDGSSIELDNLPATDGAGYSAWKTGSTSTTGGCSQASASRRCLAWERSSP